jgi:hypothetical protein
MVNCNQMGEAVGVAAALAADGTDTGGGAISHGVADVDPAALRRALEDGGSIVL